MSENKTYQKVEHLFLRCGFKSVTMDDVAKELGISKKTLYQFVSNKNDLIEKVVSAHIEQEKQLVTEVRKKAKDAIEEMLVISKHVNQNLKKVSSNLIFDLQRYYPSAWDIVENYRIKFIYEEIKSNVEWGMKEGIYRKEINPKIIAKLYIGIMHRIFDNSFFPSDEYKSSEIYLASVEYHIHGIASPKGLKLLNEYYENQ